MSNDSHEHGRAGWVQKPAQKRPYDCPDSAWLPEEIRSHPCKKSRNDEWPGLDSSPFSRRDGTQPLANCETADTGRGGHGGWNPMEGANSIVDFQKPRSNQEDWPDPASLQPKHITEFPQSRSTPTASGGIVPHPVHYPGGDYLGVASTAQIDEGRHTDQKSTVLVQDPGIAELMDIDDTCAIEPRGYVAEKPSEIPTNGVADGNHHPPVDSCFGVVQVPNVMMDFVASKARNMRREIELEITQSFVKLCDPQSKKFLGLLPPDVAPVLIALAQRYGATISAVANDTTTLAITVYGPRDNSAPIGELLSQNGHFLQPPEWDDLSLPYINPQILLPPGTDFQQWHASWETDKGGEPTQGFKVNSTTKLRIVKLLDDASGPSHFNEVHASNWLMTELKPHQRKALSMMVEKEAGNVTNPQFPSVWLETTSKTGKASYKNTVTGFSKGERPKLCLGGLLADDMGLGKTLTALALVAGSASDSSSNVGSPKLTTLVVTPLSTLTGWEDEIKRHFKPDTIDVLIYHGPRRTKWTASLQSYDIVLTTYDTVRADFYKAAKPNGTDGGSLCDTHWHRVILDEAHIIRTRKTMVFKAVSALQARHRWCLTGTPIQNSIEDLGSLVAFLRVAPFDNATTFKNTLVTPIHKGESRGWTRLASLVKAISLRRTKEAEEGSLQLPPKKVTIEPVELNPRENAIYGILLRAFTLGFESAGSNNSLFQTILRLRQVCNHGSDLLPVPMQEWLAQALRSADIPPCELLALQTCEYCDRTIEKIPGIREGSEQLLPCLHSICHRCVAISTDRDRSDNLVCPICSEDTARDEPQDQPGRVLSEYVPSSKVMALLVRLEEAGSDSSGTPIKSLVFSSWRKVLDLIENALSRRGLRYQRIDGTKTLSQRREALHSFKDDRSCTILLASIGSAAVGLDLTVASHVHLVEPSWNPMLEHQALDRVHRLGQTKPVRAFRYAIDMDTSIEQHIIRVQERKLRLISSSLRDHESEDPKWRESLNDFADTLRKGN